MVGLSDDRNFEIGAPSLVIMEGAVDNSRHTLVVLTPAWLKSEWTDWAAAQKLYSPIWELSDQESVPQIFRVARFRAFTRGGEKQLMIEMPQWYDVIG